MIQTREDFLDQKARDEFDPCRIGCLGQLHDLTVHQVEERLREAKKWINSLTAEDLLSPAMLEMPRRRPRFELAAKCKQQQMASGCLRLRLSCFIVPLSSLSFDDRKTR